MSVRPLVFALVSALIGTLALAHNAEFPIPGKKVLLKGDLAKPDKAKFVFKSDADPSIVPLHDPAVDGASLLVRGTGANAGRTSLIVLDPTKWQAGGGGYKYKDKDATRGGVKRISFQPKKLGIVAGGANWSWTPTGAQATLDVFFFVGQEQYCANFGGVFTQNEPGNVAAKGGLAQASCPASVCGNGEVEAGEVCDDGDLIDSNLCSNDCQTEGCAGTVYASTWEAIQQQIFVGHTCTNSLCHGSFTSGGLDLTAANAYADLVGAQSSLSLHQRVVPGDHSISFLWEKLANLTLAPNGPTVAGTGMPAGGATPLTVDELEAVKLWIRAGAPETGVVDGTAERLGSCLPPPTPQKIPPLVPPAAGTGVQLYAPPWPLPANSEHEVCSATYYDFTGLIDPQYLVPCPTYLGGPAETCFRYHRRLLAQDPQSHHSIIHIYRGAYAWNDASWGPWTCQGGPNAGMACNPTVVGVAAPTGADCGDPRSACGTTARDSLACIGYGPPDNGFNSNVSPQFAGAQEARQDLEFADGVYSPLPIKGQIVWNSHAFNLTTTNTTMEQYLNLYFASPPDQLYSLQGIFDDTEIFVQNVPPYQQREYCRTFTLPNNARLFELSSHMHKRGKMFRIWGPPHATCTAASGCLPDAGPPLYVSTEYNDPVQQISDPPVSYVATTAANRRFKFCALYDNGFTDPTAVKRQSTSPTALVGGPCANAATQCYLGAHQGTACNGDHAVCDSSPGLGDGLCDACPLKGGVTTEDEMFIMLGSYFIAP